MSREPKYKTFHEALKLISDREYTSAYDKLSSVKKSSIVIAGIVEATKSDKTLLQQVLTYTYTSKFAKADTVTVDQYKEARNEP